MMERIHVTAQQAHEAYRQGKTVIIKTVPDNCEWYYGAIADQPGAYTWYCSCPSGYEDGGFASEADNDITMLELFTRHEDSGDLLYIEGNGE